MSTASRSPGLPILGQLSRIGRVMLVAAAVGISALIAIDGESNWLEGALLILVYAVLGVSFFEFS